MAAPPGETLPSRDAPRAGTTVRMLYVTGPSGGARHLLPLGLVSIGRGAESSIVIDDSSVSRVHALLHVADDIAVTDLGSRNGTTVKGDRLASHEQRPLRPGETFFVGD